MDVFIEENPFTNFVSLQKNVHFVQVLTMFQDMAWYLFSAKPPHKTIMINGQLDTKDNSAGTSVQLGSKQNFFFFKKMHFIIKMLSARSHHVCSDLFMIKTAGTMFHKGLWQSVIPATHKTFLRLVLLIILPTANNACSGLLLGLHPANEKHRYKVTPSLVGWTQT